MKKKLQILVFALIALCAVSACSSKSQIEVAVTAANEECPMDLGDGMIAEKIITEGENVVYCVSVDENYGLFVSELSDYDTKMIMQEAMLEELKTEAITDSDLKELIDLIKDAKYNLVYRFTGTMTNDVVDITLRYDEF